MSDPLSVASGVAGLICLGSSTAKLFYSFFTSTVGASSSARSLASALFSLNTSLGQIQEVLLDPKFVQQFNDLDILALEGCLTRCTELFSGVEQKVERSGLTEQGQGNVRKAWESMKWVFREDDMEEVLRRIADEKATLALVLQAFTARMTAGILGKVEQLQVLAKKNDRRLKDIHVWCQWATGKIDVDENIRAGTEYSAFRARQAYTPGDLHNLLRSSGSVLSLQIGDLSDDSVSMIWTPDSISALSPRRVKSVLSPTQPTLGDLRVNQQLVTDNCQSLNGGNNYPTSPLQGLADLYTLAERSCSRRSKRQLLVDELSEAAHRFESSSSLQAIKFGLIANPILSPFGILWDAVEKGLIYARRHNANIVEQLREIGDLITIIDRAGGDSEIDEDLSDMKERILEALTEYMNHASKVFQTSSKKQVLKELVGEYERKEEELVKNIKRAVKAYRFKYQVCTQAKLLRQQQEIIDLKRRKLELKEKEMKIQLAVTSRPIVGGDIGVEVNLGSPERPQGLD